MAIVDLHAHVTPECYKTGIRTEGSWHGLDASVGELHHGSFAQGLEERLEDMDRDGVDMQLLSPTMGFYQYGNELELTKTIHREVNEEIHEMVTNHPTRFMGIGTVPMQDPTTAITELTRLVEELGFKGVMINDHVEGITYDDPRFLPFFEAAQDLGALLFFHQGGQSCVAERTTKYKVPNAVGNLTERTMLYAVLVFGGVLDKFPDLKLLLAHTGGYVPYGVARMDKVAGALEGSFDGTMNPPFGPNDGFTQQHPPSSYLDRFYYDCCTYNGPVLRFVIDTVGIDRVVFGTDYPAPMFLHDPVEWLRGLPELTDAEKEAILTDNSNSLLGI